MTNPTWISRTISGLVGLLALGAFALSYVALADIAATYGLAGWRSFIWPLLIDAGLVVFSLAVLRARLLGERDHWPWVLVGVFTLATVAFNLIHTPADVPNLAVARLVAVVPPLALFLSFETLMGMVKNNIVRAGAIATLEQVRATAAQQQTALAALTGQIETLSAKRAALESELTELRQEKRDLKRNFGDVGDDTRAQAREILAERYAQKSKPSGAELGRLLDRSSTTGRKLLAELWPEIATNGNGAH